MARVSDDYTCHAALAATCTDCGTVVAVTPGPVAEVLGEKPAT